ncbi:uncharacterized protein [Henckelia pumila]|uniref:uncharacterized protein n=1 Tax=Henckelia pumila TaxID=405737 RepID=UPI003C6E2583
MKSDVKEFVSRCLNCQQVKANRKKPGGLLHSLGTVRFCKRGKFSPIFIGPYEILEKIGNLAYRIALSHALSGIHDVFHVSMLQKYQPDPSHVLHPDEAELDETLSYFEQPMQNLDQKEKQLRNKTIPLVKVEWGHHGVEESTWEVESDMRQRFSELFH